MDVKTIQVGRESSLFQQVVLKLVIHMEKKEGGPFT